MTFRLASALDKCKVSERDAVHLTITCAEAFNLNYNNYDINRSTIKRRREVFDVSFILKLNHIFIN